MIAGLKILEVVFPIIALTAPPDSVWSMSVDKTKEDRCSAIAVTRNGDYAAVGFSTPDVIETQNHHFAVSGYSTPEDVSKRDGWIVVSTPEGELLWEKGYGGDREETLLSVLPLPSDELLVSGFTASFGNGQRDVWIFKTDSIGNMLWSKTFGGPKRDVAIDLKQLDDGGFIAVGRTESLGEGQMDGLMMRFDENCDSLWARTFGGPQYEDFHNVCILPDGYLATGSTTTNSIGSRDAWAVKTDKQGNELWSWQNRGSGLDVLRSAFILTDSTYCVAGYTDTYGAGKTDVWLVCLSSEGDSLWSRTYGGSGNEVCSFSKKTADGHILLCGHTYSFGTGMADAWLLKVNTAGDSIWSAAFGGTMNDEAYSLFQTEDLGIVFVGFTTTLAEHGTDFWIMKTGLDTANVGRTN